MVEQVAMFIHHLLVSLRKSKIVMVDEMAIQFLPPDMVQFLSLSLRTTERRLQKFGMSLGQFFTTIDNETLDRTVKTILRSFPSYGDKIVCFRI